MMKQTMVATYFGRYAKLDKEIDRLMREKETWEKRWKQTGGHNEMLEVKIRQMETRLDERIDHLVALRDEMLERLEEIEDDTLRLLMEYRYIDGMTWERLAEKMNYSYQHVFRLHKKALECLERSERRIG